MFINKMGMSKKVTCRRVVPKRKTVSEKEKRYKCKRASWRLEKGKNGEGEIGKNMNVLEG